MFEYKAEIKRVVDGDTYDLEVDLGFKIKHTIRVRLAGIDTPEYYKPRCPLERAHAEAAILFVEKEIAEEGGSVMIHTSENKGKYGRYIASIHYGDEYQYDLTMQLVANGFEKQERYTDEP